MNKQTNLIATLVATTQEPVKSKHKTHETAYTYKVGDKVFKFHSHPTRAFNWVIMPETTMDRKTFMKILDAVCAAGFEPDDIKTLTLK